VTIQTASCSKAALATAALLALCSQTSLLADSAPATVHSLHVEVLAKCSDGKPVGWLRTRDFQITLQGQVVPMAVARPRLKDKPSQSNSIPTQLLVVFNAPSEDSDEGFAGLLKALEPVWPRAWRVAIAHQDGRVTDYATNPAELGRMWTAPSRPGTTVKAAVADLASPMGRHIVLVLSGNQKASTPTPGWLTQMANDEMEEVFVVDGGQPDAFAESIGSDIPGSYPPAEPATAVGGFGRVSSQGSEVSVHRAVRDAMRLGLGYYDLRVICPDTEPIPSDAVLSLRIKGPSSFTVAAQAWGKNGVPQLQVAKK
jgi:hypothetical protein